MAIATNCVACAIVRLWKSLPCTTLAMLSGVCPDDFQEHTALASSSRVLSDGRIDWPAQKPALEIACRNVELASACATGRQPVSGAMAAAATAARIAFLIAAPYCHFRAAGANPKVVRRMLGHASAAMTLGVYADLFDSDLDARASKQFDLALVGCQKPEQQAQQRGLSAPFGPSRPRISPSGTSRSTHSTAQVDP